MRKIIFIFGLFVLTCGNAVVGQNLKSVTNFNKSYKAVFKNVRINNFYVAYAKIELEYLKTPVKFENLSSLDKSFQLKIDSLKQNAKIGRKHKNNIVLQFTYTKQIFYNIKKEEWFLALEEGTKALNEGLQKIDEGITKVVTEMQNVETEMHKIRKEKDE
jgi:hypothetical protein